MKARMWVERTVIDNERETNTGIGNPCSVSSRVVPSPTYHSRSASTTTWRDHTSKRGLMDQSGPARQTAEITPQQGGGGETRSRGVEVGVRVRGFI